MPNFKPKTNKKINIDEKSIVTVDTKHEELLEQFKNDEDELSKYKNEKRRLQQIIKKKKYDSIDTKIEMEDRIYDLQNKIKSLKSKKKNYMLENSKFVFDYFENKKNIVQNNNKKKVLDSFFKVNTNEIQDEEDESNNSKKYLVNVDEEFIDINGICS